MKSKYLKILISFILIVSLCLALTTTQSMAIPAPIVIGGGALAVGGLAWAIANAMGVSFDMQEYTSQTIGESFDPWYSVQTALQSSDFTLIKGFRTGFDALRLSLTAYNAIKEASENIIESNDIQDNTTGNIDGKQAFDVVVGVPFASVYKTTNPGISTPDGGILYSSNPAAPFSVCRFDNSPIFEGWGTGSIFDEQWPVQVRYIANENNQIAMQCKFANSSTWETKTSYHNVSTTPIDMDYESGVVDTSFGQTALDNITVVFPQTVLPSTATLDDILEAINNLALSGSEDVSLEVDAVPSPPIPTDALGDIPFDQFIDIYGGSVFEEIDNQTQVIDTLGQSVGQYIQDQTDTIDTYGQSVVEGIEDQTDVIDTVGQSVVTAVENQTDVIDTVGQDVVDAIESVDTNIQTGTGILSGIRSLVDSAVDTLEDISEMVGEIVEDIVLGTETLISGILNQIPGLFNVILSPIKTAASIWHYVVEWIQSITSPFQFIWSMANGTSYYIVLPVYASLAAAVVLAFYKRFGK